VEANKKRKTTQEIWNLGKIWKKAINRERKEHENYT
jgi:hypothetical protein